MKIKKLSESIDVNNITHYIIDNYEFDDMQDKHDCINSIRDSFKNEKTISKEELEQFIGAHNGRDKVNESKSIREDTYGYKSGDRYYGGLPNDEDIFGNTILGPKVTDPIVDMSNNDEKAIDILQREKNNLLYKLILDDVRPDNQYGGDESYVSYSDGEVYWVFTILLDNDCPTKENALLNIKSYLSKNNISFDQNSIGVDEDDDGEDVYVFVSVPVSSLSMTTNESKSINEDKSITSEFDNLIAPIKAKYPDVDFIINAHNKLGCEVVADNNNERDIAEDEIIKITTGTKFKYNQSTDRLNKSRGHRAYVNIVFDFDDTLLNESKYIKEDGLDDHGMSKTSVNIISKQAPNSKFYVDKDRYVLGKDLPDYFDSDEIVEYTQYETSDGIRVPNSYTIVGKSVSESKSINESSYKKGDRVELDNGMTGTVTKDFDWENEDQVSVKIDGTGEMRYPRSETLRDLNESIRESKATHCVYFTQDGIEQIEFEGTEAECDRYISAIQAEQDDEFGDEAPERFIKRLTEGMDDLRNKKGQVMADKWYARTYPNDEVGIEQLKGITLDDALKDRKILGHCDTQVRERVYAQLDKYIPLSKESPMYKEKNESKHIKETLDESLFEASYGGAFDIADDQYFTREDIEEACEPVLEHINETFNDRYVLGGTWFENGKWIVNVQTENGMEEYEAQIDVDINKIKSARDLKEYVAGKMAAALISQIKEFNEDLNESVDASIKVGDKVHVDVAKKDGVVKKVNGEYIDVETDDGKNPIRIDTYYKNEVKKMDGAANLSEDMTTDAEPIKTGSAVGMAQIISDLIKDEYEAIDGYNSAIATAESEGYANMIEVLTDIQAEENVHIGQLQELMKMVDPNAHMIEDGEEEAEEELSNPIM